MFSKNSRKWLLAMGVGVATLGGASLATAGMRWSYWFTMDVPERRVEAVLSAIRNDSSGSNYAGCWIQGDAAGGALSCYGYDGTNSISCYHPKSKPNFTPLLLAVQSLSGDSLLQFKANADGTCAYIYVTNASYWEPKKP